jgi:hypothetical protein
MSLALPNAGIDVEAMVGKGFYLVTTHSTDETTCNAPVMVVDSVSFCLVASPGRIMSYSMRRKRYMLHSNGPQVIVGSQWSAVNVIFGRKNRRCTHHGGKRRMSQAVRTARCRTPPTFMTMARSRREIDTAAYALDRKLAL